MVNSPFCQDSDGSISTSVYRKPTHTDQYLHFQSHHPVAHKWAVVKTLMGRAEDLSSTVNRVEEEKHVVEALQTNGYRKRQTWKGCSAEQ